MIQLVLLRLPAWETEPHPIHDVTTRRVGTIVRSKSAIPGWCCHEFSGFMHSSREGSGRRGLARFQGKNLCL